MRQRTGTYIPQFDQIPAMPPDQRESAAVEEANRMLMSAGRSDNMEALQPAVASSPAPIHRNVAQPYSPPTAGIHRQLFTPQSNGHHNQNGMPSAIRLASSSYSPQRTPVTGGQGRHYSMHSGCSGQSQVVVSSCVPTPSLQYDPIEGNVIVPAQIGLSRRATIEHEGTKFQFPIPSHLRPGSKLAVQLRGGSDNVSPFPPVMAPPANWGPADDASRSIVDRGRYSGAGYRYGEHHSPDVTLSEEARALQEAAARNERERQSRHKHMHREWKQAEATRSIREKELLAEKREATRKFEATVQDKKHYEKLLRLQKEIVDINEETESEARERDNEQQAYERAHSISPTSMGASNGCAPSSVFPFFPTTATDQSINSGGCTSYEPPEAAASAPPSADGLTESEQPREPNALAGSEISRPNGADTAAAAAAAETGDWAAVGAALQATDEERFESKKIIRKGEEAVVVKIDRAIEPPSYVVRLSSDGREIGTEAPLLQRWQAVPAAEADHADMSRAEPRTFSSEPLSRAAASRSAGALTSVTTGFGVTNFVAGNFVAGEASLRTPAGSYVSAASGAYDLRRSLPVRLRAPEAAAQPVQPTTAAQQASVVHTNVHLPAQSVQRVSSVAGPRFMPNPAARSSRLTVQGLHWASGHAPYRPCSPPMAYRVVQASLPLQPQLPLQPTMRTPRVVSRDTRTREDSGGTGGFVLPVLRPMPSLVRPMPSGIGR